MHWYWFGFTQLHILSISLVIMTPLSVVFAWVFFRVCERPFMRPLAVKAPVQTHNNPQIDRAPMETTLEVMSPR
jgi:peptidoglycan/LPS O-acetylase OafA/YrhL